MGSATHSSSAGIMEELSAALNSALERALTGDSATPLTPNDVASKSREEIEAAVLEALGASAVLDAIRNPDLVHSLLLEMAATGKRERVISALQQGANPNSR
jgi:saccharopine dehydrogenase-like NADP-dependent oxidoreductase